VRDLTQYRSLLEFGLDFNLQDLDGRVPAMNNIHQMFDDNDVLRLEGLFDLNIADKEGRTVLLDCMFSHDLRRQIEEAGADVEFSMSSIQKALDEGRVTLHGYDDSSIPLEYTMYPIDDEIVLETLLQTL
jgi:hypothetical protein